MKEKVKIGDYVRIYDGGIGQVVDIKGNEVEVSIIVFETLPIEDVEVVN